LALYRAFTDTVIAGAAAATGWAAYRALDTWRLELASREEHESARRVLRCVYQSRESLFQIRAPFAVPSSSSEATPEISAGETARRAIAESYQARWGEVDAAFANLKAELLASEPLFGRDLDSAFDGLQKAKGRLFGGLLFYLTASRDPDFAEHMGRKVWAQSNADLFGIEIGDAQDRVGPAIAEGVRAFENYLRPRLIRRERVQEKERVRKIIAREWLSLVGCAVVAGVILLMLGLWGSFGQRAYEQKHARWLAARDSLYSQISEEAKAKENPIDAALLKESGSKYEPINPDARYFASSPSLDRALAARGLSSEPKRPWLPAFDFPGSLAALTLFLYGSSGAVRLTV
jgi:hypothetical protein